MRGGGRLSYCDMTKFRKFSLVALLALLSSPALAAGDDTVTKVRELAKEAQVDSNAGRFDAAVQKLKQAYQMARVPALARNIARALVKQGKLVAACDYYREASQLEQNELWREQLQQTAQHDAAAELAALLPRLSHLQIVIEGSSKQGTTVSVDNVDVPKNLAETEWAVDPGKRHVIAKHGEQVVEQNVELKEGEHRKVVMQLATNSPAPIAAKLFESNNETHRASKRSIQPTLGWVSLGIGAAGLAVGTTAGIIAEMKLSKLHSDGCRDQWCPSSFSGRVDSYNQLLTVSTVGFIVGAVGAAAGVTLLLTSPHHESKPAVGLWVGPSSVALKGGF